MVLVRQLHPWRVSLKRALEIQKLLKKRTDLKRMPLSIKKVAGVDVSYSGDRLTAVVCVFKCSRTGLKNLIEVGTAVSKISFPYVPGFLTFREGPVILKAFRKIKNRPDVILFDGQGICHPRRMGEAAHLGVILDTPSIGCAKSSLYGIYKMPAKEKGSFSFIYDKKTGEKLGAVLRTRAEVRPIFVSQGYKTGLRQCIDLVLRLCSKYRIPEPLRYAHMEAGKCR